MTEMLSNPNFAQMMNEALQNPQLVDMMIQQNPQLRAMGPQARQMLQSEQFRQMITNPQALQQMAQLSRTMGLGPFGSGGGASAFPMPGATNTTPAENRDAGTTPNTGTGSTAQQNPFAALLGGGGGGVSEQGLRPQDSGMQALGRQRTLRFCGGLGEGVLAGAGEGRVVL